MDLSAPEILPCGINHFINMQNLNYIHPKSMNTENPVFCRNPRWYKQGASCFMWMPVAPMWLRICTPLWFGWDGLRRLRRCWSQVWIPQTRLEESGGLSWANQQAVMRVPRKPPAGVLSLQPTLHALPPMPTLHSDQWNQEAHTKKTEWWDRGEMNEWMNEVMKEGRKEWRKQASKQQSRGAQIE